ncbi:MAG: hypothetical protein ACXVPQ_06000 [Bacteroidia bacterium]
MKKEEWIDTILESTDQLKPAEANPYLYNKIITTLEQPPAFAAQRPVVFRVALAGAAVLILNIGCFAVKSHMEKERAGEAAVASLGTEMGFNNTLNY